MYRATSSRLRALKVFWGKLLLFAYGIILSRYSQLNEPCDIHVDLYCLPEAISLLKVGFAYLRVLNAYPQIHAFSAFSSIYNNTGLFGIQAATISDFAPRAIEVAVKELTAVANPGEVDMVQLDRAKQSTKSALLMNLESRMVASEDIGRQLLTYGERKPVEHFLKAIDAISANDIASVAQKLISSPLTMASYGDVLSLPTYDVVSSRFHSKIKYF